MSPSWKMGDMAGPDAAPQDAPKGLSSLMLPPRAEPERRMIGKSRTEDQGRIAKNKSDSAPFWGLSTEKILGDFPWIRASQNGALFVAVRRKKKPRQMPR